ncbi:MAG: LEA type 2 family protein [Dysgonamonadaceae bacterium]|jgi:LEA14-like dessication related protein|nr:LEA type 2 family protein [Dysgonamonadaceae bacterium]
MKKFVALFCLAGIMFSCDIAQQLAGTLNMTQCKYDYNSISAVSLAGINLNASSLTSLNPLTLANLYSQLSSPTGSLPISFTLNVDVSNPSATVASLSGLSYALQVEDVELTQGTMSQRFQVDAGGKTVLPISMAFDLKQAMSGKSADAIKNLALGIAGIGGGQETKVTLNLKPSFLLGNQVISSPAYIPVSFTVK